MPRSIVIFRAADAEPALMWGDLPLLISSYLLAFPIP